MMTSAPFNRHRRALAILCAAVWLAAFVATHISLKGMPSPPTNDKTIHFAMFVILTTLFLTALLAYGYRGPGRAILPVVVMAAYAAVDEWTQALVGREPSVADWVADILGAITALVLFESIRAAVLLSRTVSAD